MIKKLFFLMFLTSSYALFSQGYQNSPLILDGVVRDYKLNSPNQCDNRVNASIYLSNELPSNVRLNLTMKTDDGRTVFSKSLKRSDFIKVAGVYDYNTPELDITSFGQINRVYLSVTTYLVVGVFPVYSGLPIFKRESGQICN